MVAYALAKTGPLPMVAGFVSASGSLEVLAVLTACGIGTLAGANLRFALGHLFNTRLFRWAPKAAPWIALGAVGVDRLGWWLLPVYRFSKGTFTLIGLGAGITMRYRKFFVLDAIGPDGHPKLPHLWPVKLLQAGRSNYDDSVLIAMRAAASLRR